jgi:hypothetical protein
MFEFDVDVPSSAVVVVVVAGTPKPQICPATAAQANLGVCLISANRHCCG